MRQRAQRMQSAGFSLIEVVVVIALLIIMSTAAVSGFQELVRGVRVRTAAQDLFSGLLLARSEAVKRNVDVTVTPAADGWAAGWDISVAGELIQRQKPMLGVTMTIAPASVTFTRNGRLPAGVVPPEFQIAATSDGGSSMRCIVVELSGMPHLSKGEC